MLYKALALFAAGAAVAAPVAQQQYQPEQQPQQSTDYQALWSSQLASMESVLHAMASTPGGYTPSTPTPAPGPGGYASTTRVTSTITKTIQSGGGYTPGPTGSSSPTTPKAPNSSPSPSGSGSQPTPSGYDSNSVKVTNPQAFQNGCGSKSGTASGGSSMPDSYQCYGSTANTLPSSDKWESYEAMFENNKQLMGQACSNLGYSPDNSPQQIDMIKNGIDTVAKQALVDPRVILAIIMQESHGCLAVPTTNNGISNPGLMQSHNGVKWVGNSASQADQQKNIIQQIADGTQGTNGQPGGGDGLVQGINQYGNVYAAARLYNSGSVDTSNLNNGFSSTASYVADIAARLTGWVENPGTSKPCGAGY